MQHAVPGGSVRRRDHHSTSRRTFPECGRGIFTSTTPRQRGRGSDTQVNVESKPAPPMPAALDFPSAIRTFLARQDLTPAQRFVGAVVQAVREDCPQGQRGTLRATMEAAGRTPSYALTAVGAALDLGHREINLPATLRRAVETCARIDRDGPWSELLDPTRGNLSLDDIFSALDDLN